jgi:glycine betaine/proline transport system substrate-binding protein
MPKAAQLWSSRSLGSNDPREGRGRKITRVALLGILLILAALAVGCSGGSSSAKTLDIADIGWTENTAVSALTDVLLEDQLGYQVTTHTKDLDSVYGSVAQGELNAFEDVWLPNQQDKLNNVKDNVEVLGPWYQGQTKQGIAVPSYMDTTSLDQLNESEADLILGIEPSSVVMEKVYDEVIPAYGLQQELVEAPTAGMLAEVEKLYRDREEFAFIAWSPHWMNQEYDIRYLQDPKNAFGELNDPVQVMTVVNKDLGDQNPEAYAFMKVLTLNEKQLDDLESTINEEGDPRKGARTWAEENREVWQPWVDAAQNAQEEKA